MAVPMHSSSAILRWPGRSATPLQAMRTRMRGFTLAFMTKHRIYATSFASVYPLYVAKAEKKGRTKAEVDQIVLWLTGYSLEQFEAQLESRKDFETFFAEAPHLNPLRALIKGVIGEDLAAIVRSNQLRNFRRDPESLLILRRQPSFG